MINKDMIIYNILLLGTILIIAIGSTRYSDPKLFNCSNLIITGCDLSNEINIKNQFEYLENKSIFDINKNDIRIKLINNNFISSADIVTILPNTIIISIVEIEPISIIKIENNSFLVDKNNSGFAYDDNSSKKIEIPRIYIEDINGLENVFEQFEYKFIQNIYSNYYSLYKKINKIRKTDNKLMVSFNINQNNNKVYFDYNDYQNQTEYLDAFLSILDSLHKKYYYDYIKFSGQTIIVKEERNI